VEVLAILDRWISPERRYFKLRCEDGGIYILRHDLVRDLWELVLYDASRGGAQRLSST
jgi:hypothetical protein